MAAEDTPELFSPGSSWGDSDMPEETLTLPQALHFLEERGVGFNMVGRYLGSSTTTVKKNLSVYFAVDTVVSSQDIIEGFDAAGLDVDDISSIQRKNSNNTWVVSFNSADCKERALALPSLQIAGCSVVLGDSENTTVIVKIYEAPEEMPDTMIIGRLSAYGTVLSFRRDKISSTISNGIRTARVRLKKPIPSAAYIAGEVVYFFYASQPRTCRRCGLEGHMARSCSAVRCYSCEKPGHRSSECEEPTRCSVCLESSHDLAGCPFVFYSANVAPPVPGAATYAEVLGQRSAGPTDPPPREPTDHADWEISSREEVTDADELNSPSVRVPLEREEGVPPEREEVPPEREVPPEGEVPPERDGSVLPGGEREVTPEGEGKN